MKVSKDKHNYFSLSTDGLGGNLNPSLRPSLHVNEGVRQNNICQETL